MGRELKLSFSRPAQEFSEAIPVGNGEMGGMVYGGVPRGMITLNMDTLWSGTGRREEKEVSVKALEEARRLIFSEKYSEGEAYIKKHFLGDFTEAYQPMGILEYEYPELGEYQEYERVLNLSEGTVDLSFQTKERKICSKIFSSYPDRCLVGKWKSDDFRMKMRFTVGSCLKHEIKTGNTFLICMGRAPTHIYAKYYGRKESVIYNEENPGMPFAFQIEILECDGQIQQNSQYLEISEASSLTVVLTAVTGYQGYKKSVLSPDMTLEALKKKINKILKKTVLQLYREHLKDYQSLFGRMEFSLELEETEPRYDEYFQFCRYLLISCSRKGTQAANLQGIWNEDPMPAWNCNYTMNINLPMNYWGAYSGNLEECFEPLLNLAEELADAGKETAKKKFHMRGWCMGHNTDLWRQTEMTGGNPQFAFWPMGGVWLANEIFRIYAYNRDQTLYQERIYPIIKGATQFCLDYLIPGKDGKMHTCPSTSPENVFIDQKGKVSSTAWSSTMDLDLIRELFRNLQIAGVPENDTDFLQEVIQADRNLALVKKTNLGTRSEWYPEVREKDPGHRHFSNLYGCYPGHCIDVSDMQEKEICRKTIERRLCHGGAGTGWSLVWLICLYAKLQDGESAFQYLERLLQHSTFPNGMDLHPPIDSVWNGNPIFQIDGNLGAIEAILMMLIQCEAEKIRLFPATPKVWKSGRVRGIRLPDRLTVDLQWKEGHLTDVVFQGPPGIRKILYYRENLFLGEEKIQSIQIPEKGALRFQITKESI